jgi:3-hydroxybutyryl-CoA dehydrogenase
MSDGPIAVLGAGTMGHGIAQVLAMAGYETRLFDVDESALETAVARIDANLTKGIERGKVDAVARERTLAALTTHTDVGQAAGGTTAVIEAAPERLSLKQELLTACAEAAGAETLLATNTSSLSISRIGEAVPGPERVVGMHFFNPVHIMALLEIVQGQRTTDASVEHARAIGDRLGKTSIVVQDSPGFASSRLGVVLGLEAIRMLEEGVASAEDIDTAMKLGYRHPMGPLRLGDLVGLDVRLDIARYLHRELASPRFEPPALLERMVAEGKLGQKSGQGFYSWED